MQVGRRKHRRCLDPERLQNAHDGIEMHNKGLPVILANLRTMGAYRKGERGRPNPPRLASSVCSRVPCSSSSAALSGNVAMGGQVHAIKWRERARGRLPRPADRPGQSRPPRRTYPRAGQELRGRRAHCTRRMGVGRAARNGHLLAAASKRWVRNSFAGCSSQRHYTYSRNDQEAVHVQSNT
jgi:hypothetical protein